MVTSETGSRSQPTLTPHDTAPIQVEDSGNAHDDDANSLWQRSYGEVIFAATHNSYSGGERGGILTQLNAGIRGIELDIHDDDFSSVGDYEIGHAWPGQDIDDSIENPGPYLSDWLNAIATWSDSQPQHAPITLTIDIKDDLNDNLNVENGNLIALNRILSETLGQKMVLAEQWTAPWPSIESLRGSIIVVLSGHEGTRLAYVRDRGQHPAVAINDHGQIVEVHQSPSTHTLWYWTGQLHSDGSVEWMGHGQYDTGTHPSVTLDNAGWVVEVHQSSIRPALFYRIGRLDENHGITWGSSHEFDAGQQPTIRFLDLDENQLVERHLGVIDSTQRWTWTAQIDREAWTIEFDQRNTTEEERWADESASADIGQIKVWAGPDQTSGSDTLQYESDSGFNGRIRYSQMAFMEIQASFDSALLQESTQFFAAPSGESESAKNWANLGWQTRIWGFSDTDLDEAIPHFPSTDTPFADWYIQMCQERNTPQ